MKKVTLLEFKDLNTEQQTKQIERVINSIVEFRLETGESGEGDVIAMEAINKATLLKTPWFAGQILYEMDKKAIDNEAACIARESFYNKSGQMVSTD
jgi:hypothetical protein